MEILKFVRAQWDRTAAWVAVVLGAFVLVIGYIGTSDAQHIVLQMPYFVSGGLGGIFLLGIGGMLWLSADLRDQWRELRSLRETIERLHGEDAPTLLPLEAEAAATVEPAGDDRHRDAATANGGRRPLVAGTDNRNRRAR